MAGGVDPRTLLSEFGVDQEQIPQYVDDLTLWKLIINMIAEPPRRNKLRHVNTLDDVVRLLKGIYIIHIIKKIHVFLLKLWVLSFSWGYNLLFEKIFYL